MMTIEQIKKEIINLYGGDTEQFKKYNKEIAQMAIDGKTIPEIVYELFHKYRVMSTPDSLTGYFKAYNKGIKPSRKNKRILLNDKEYQLALEERARVNNCNYQYYSKSSKEKAKKERVDLKKSRIRELSLSNWKTSDFNEIKRIINESKSERETKWRKSKDEDINLEETARLIKEVYSLDKTIKKYEAELDFHKSMTMISQYLNADTKTIHITYLEKESE